MFRKMFFFFRATKRKFSEFIHRKEIAATKARLRKEAEFNIEHSQSIFMMTKNEFKRNRGCDCQMRVFKDEYIKDYIFYNGRVFNPSDYVVYYQFVD